jgi:hypothetical protein
MFSFNGADLETPDEVLAAVYCLAHTYARDQLRGGTHPDAVRFTMHLAAEDEPALTSPVIVAKWRGLEDALAGRSPSLRPVVDSRGRRIWRLDPPTYG